MRIAFYNITEISEFDLKQWFAEMPEDRQEKCRRMYSKSAQKCCIAADHLARKSVAEYLQKPIHDLEILRTAEGKPYVAENPCYFSISHSGELVVCALSDNPVGVDVERIRAIDLGIATKICTEEELNFLNGVPEDETRNRALLEIWTKKEAIFKIEGKLPRKDREVNTLAPISIDLRTSKFENYLISVAEKTITPEYSW